MATSPDWASTPVNGSVAVSSSADTSYTSPSHAVEVLEAGSNGSKIDEIRFQGIGTTVSGTITVFIYNGSSYSLIDCITVPAITASTTSAPWQLIKAYANLELESGQYLYVSSTVASQLVEVSAFGGSF